MKYHIELRPSEGGQDASNFALELMRSYTRLSDLKG